METASMNNKRMINLDRILFLKGGITMVLVIGKRCPVSYYFKTRKIPEMGYVGIIAFSFVVLNTDCNC